MSGASQIHPLSRLPKVDRVLEHPALHSVNWRRPLVRRLVADTLAEVRRAVLQAVEGSSRETSVPSLEAVATQVRALLDSLDQRHPQAVLNGTGVLLHTNLGRAPLSADAREAVLAACGYCDLELELTHGKRGSRMAALRPLLRSLFQAPDTHVVNNGAAALLLACSALGHDGVILSRGQHVEIGDSFRVADMAAAGGASVVAIGSTNRTHLRDYEAALDLARRRAATQDQDHAGTAGTAGTGGTAGTAGTAGPALLWVHPSNFTQAGFVSSVSLAQLAGLAKARGVPLIADLGSGSLGRGLPPGEPSVSSYLEQGADLVTFSGDKLLGGPQAGVLAGDAALVARCRRHPMARALRPGKLALAALHATALAHARPTPAGEPERPELPLHRMIAEPVEALRARGLRLCRSLGWPESCVRPNHATIGGGSLPGEVLESIALVPPLSAGAQAAATCLRRGAPGVPPMVGRVRDRQLWLDLRTLLDVPDHTLTRCLARL